MRGIRMREECSRPERGFAKQKEGNEDCVD